MSDEELIAKAEDALRALHVALDEVDPYVLAAWRSLNARRQEQEILFIHRVPRPIRGPNLTQYGVSYVLEGEHPDWMIKEFRRIRRARR